MPQLGETVTEGTITRWMKAVGDAVERDEPLFEVSTDKVDSEVPSPAAGVLSRDPGPRGRDGRGRREAGGDRRGAGSHGRPGAAAAAARRAAAPPAGCPRRLQPAAPAPVAAQDGGTPHRHRHRHRRPRHPRQPPAAPAPAARAHTGAGSRRAIDGDGVGPHVLSPDGAQAAGRERDRRIRGRRDRLWRAHHPRRCAAGGRRSAGRPPPQRHRPATSCCDRHRLRRSCSAAPAARRPAPAAPVARAPQAPPVSMASFRAAGDQVVPFSNMRRRTAEHMVRSKATSPHAFIANEVDFENVERVRKAWGDRFKAEEGFALTYLPFVARAAVEALRDFPLLERVRRRRLLARPRRRQSRDRGRPCRTRV